MTASKRLKLSRRLKTPLAQTKKMLTCINAWTASRFYFLPMKQTSPLHLTITLALSALLFSACSRQPAVQLPEKQIEITANDAMKFSVTAFEVKAGQKVSVTLKNIGTAPKASMGHNWILIKPGTAPAAFVDAGSMYASANYIAPEMKDKVIAATKLLGPGESDTATFVAPTTPGKYDFLCAFPGHFTIGMKGVMTVN